MYGKDHLKTRLTAKRERVLLRYGYYEMKHKQQDFCLTTPPEFRRLAMPLGWCGKAVDSLADRLSFREFDNDIFKMNDIYALNNADVLFDSAILSALISSCCYIYIRADAEGFPKMQVVDGANAIGIIDETTGLLKEGYAVLDRDVFGSVTLDAYFTAGLTEFTEYKDKKKVNAYTVPNAAPAPLLVPIINRPDAIRPFGHSRISRAAMSIMQGAQRTLKRAEVSAEFYSYPQRYVLGLSEDAEFESWRATMSSFLSLTKDEDGDRPTVGQFSQQSMSPFVEQLRMQASLFAGETGLTLDDLGFATDNPSSADAIKASHESLRLMARKAQKNFGVGFVNAGYLAACVRDDFAYKRNAVANVKATWGPIFEPDAAMLSSIGDGAIKINQAIPDYFTKKNLRDLTGIDTAE